MNKEEAVSTVEQLQRLLEVIEMQQELILSLLEEIESLSNFKK